MSMWERLKAGMEGGMRQRITASGWLFTTLLLVVGVVAFLSANNLLFILLSSLLATLLVSGFISRLSLAGLELDLVFPEHISARRHVTARLRLHNEKNWMPSFSILVSGGPRSAFTSTLYFPVAPGGAVLEESAEVCFQRRGLYRDNSFRLISRFPFGFAERTALVTLRREVIVYPCLEPRPELEVLLGSLLGEIAALARGRGHDFYRIRPYEHLESVRHVDWRASAHTGQLQVREFAREEEPLVELFLDLNIRPEDTEWFENAVDGCAYIAWDVSRRSARLCFRTQNFHVTLPEEGDLYTVLKYLALVEARTGKPILPPESADSVRVIFTPLPERAREAGWENAHVVDGRFFQPVEASMREGAAQPAGTTPLTRSAAPPPDPAARL